MGSVTSTVSSASIRCSCSASSSSCRFAERLLHGPARLADALAGLLAGLRRQRPDLAVGQGQRRPVAGVLDPDLLQRLEVGGARDRGERGVARGLDLLGLQRGHLHGVEVGVRSGHGTSLGTACRARAGEPGVARPVDGPWFGGVDRSGTQLACRTRLRAVAAVRSSASAVPSPGPPPSPPGRRRRRRTPGSGRGSRRASRRPGTSSAASRTRPRLRGRSSNTGTASAERLRRKCQSTRPVSAYRSRLRSAIQASGLIAASPEQRDHAGDEREARQPDAPAHETGDRHREHHQAEPALEDVDQQPELREAVGLLVEVHPVQRGADHDQGQGAEQRRARPAARPGRRACRRPSARRPRRRAG